MALTSHWFSKHISDLKVDGDMWKRNNVSIHGFSNRMTIHFGMLGTLMENRIGSNLNSTRVVSMKKSRSSLGKSNFYKQSTKPNNLRASSWHGSIFILSRRFENTILFLTLPRYQGITKKHTPTCDRATCIRTTCPIDITKSNKADRRTSRVE
jgi:hypothetical protein